MSDLGSTRTFETSAYENFNQAPKVVLSFKSRSPSAPRLPAIVLPAKNPSRQSAPRLTRQRS